MEAHCRPCRRDVVDVASDHYRRTVKRKSNDGCLRCFIVSGLSGVGSVLNLEAVPSELKEREQWVLWKREKRHGKVTKVLLNCRNGRPAESDAPETWSRFEDAVEGLTVFGEADGIGFVFSADDPYVGIDLDSCVDADGEIATWARDLINEIDTYTEKSPSGTGIHMLARGDLPPHGRRKGPFEIYNRERYFTITGDHVWDTPTGIKERREEILALHRRVFPPPVVAVNGAKPLQPISVDDETLIEKARQANPRFDLLWTGDRRGYDSASEADLALCDHLAWWTGNDVERIERLFGQSALVREKWTNRPDYRAMTIAKAVSGVTSSYSPSRNGAQPHPRETEAIEEEPDTEALPELAGRVLTFAELLVQPPLQWMVEGVVQDLSLLLIYGPTNEGKTFITGTLAHAVRTGGVWCGRRIDRLGPVLYVNAEYGAEFAERARAWQVLRGQEGLPMPEHEFYTFPDPIHLHDPEQMYHLYRLLEWLNPPPVLVIFDTYSQCIPGVDENAQGEGSRIVMGLRKIIRDHNASVAVVHHTNASGERERGSTVLPNAAHTHIRVDMDKGTRLITASCKKQRGGARFDPFTFRLERVPGTNEVWPQWMPEKAPMLSAQQIEREERLGSILEFIREIPGSPTETIQLAFNLTQTTCDRDLEELVKRKLIFPHKREREPGERGRPGNTWWPESRSDE